MGGLSAEKIVVELLDAVRVARTASSLIIAHVESIAELARLEWDRESISLRKFLFGMQLFAVLVGLTLLYGGLFFAAITWDTPYRLHVLALLPLLFVVASYRVWRFLVELSQQREEHFVAFRVELEKSLQLLRRDP